MGVLTYLGVGSNLGDPEANVRHAIERLGHVQGFSKLRASSLWKSAPWGNPAQPDYVNAVVEVRSAIEPARILENALRIEEEAGRVRGEEGTRYAPRKLDVDLLFYGAAVLNEPSLQLPHPRLHERRFVLEPLRELNPELVHPVLGATVLELRERCPDQGAVEKLWPVPK